MIYLLKKDKFQLKTLFKGDKTVWGCQNYLSNNSVEAITFGQWFLWQVKTIFLSTIKVDLLITNKLINVTGHPASPHKKVMWRIIYPCLSFGMAETSQENLNNHLRLQTANGSIRFYYVKMGLSLFQCLLFWFRVSGRKGRYANEGIIHAFWQPIFFGHPV